MAIVGWFAGILSGMFGIGGGVVIVPALNLIAGLPLVESSGTSLAALLLPVGIFAVREYHKAKQINIRASAWIALGIVLGVSFGTILALHSPAQLLKQIYGCFLLYVSWVFINPKTLFSKNKNKAKTIEFEEISPLWYKVLGLGLGAGVLSGLFGIGGGLVITPVLMSIFHFSPQKAVGTSLGALLLPVGLPGVLLYYQSGNLDLVYAGILALGLLIGALSGAKIAVKLNPKTAKQLYGFFLLIMGMDFIFYKYFL